MIKLTKKTAPDILLINATIWTLEYLTAIKNNSVTDTIQQRYSHEDIKKTLIEETNSKCAYCESKVTDVSPGDIEHILPKKERPDLYVDWDNLTFACEICNRSGKGTYYDVNLPLVNPYVDNPKDFFRFIGSLILPIINNNRSRITYSILKLGRNVLVESRSEKIENIDKLLQAWQNTTNVNTKKVLEFELHDTYSADKEYCGTIKEYLRNNDFPVK